MTIAPEIIITQPENDISDEIIQAQEASSEQGKATIEEQPSFNENSNETCSIQDKSANWYYAICSKTHSRLSGKSVGGSAKWDFDLKMWFFQYKEEAEIIAEKFTNDEKEFNVKRLQSKIVDVLLYGTAKQKKALKARCKYEIACEEFKIKVQAFDNDCEKYNMDKSFILEPIAENSSEKDKAIYALLKKKWNDLEKEKYLLDELRIKCEELEQLSDSKTVVNVLKNNLPVIQIIAGQLHDITNCAESIINSPNLGIFQRSGKLVRIITEASKPKKNKLLDKEGNEIRNITRSADSLLISPVDPIFLTEFLGKHANWTKFDERKDDWVIRDCPEKVAKTLIARGEWNIPVLTGIIQAPTLRDDGSILDQPGYDEITGLFFATGNTSFYPIPSFPSKDDAIQARDKLLFLLKDFTFENEESKSVALSAKLTGLIRKSLRTAPLHGYSAHKMGSGKSLLSDLVGLISTGKNNSVISQSENETEEKKRLLAVLAEGDPIVCYDNIEHPFGSPALCSVLTQEDYKDRILGASKNLTVLTNATFLATGNNLTFVGDTSTRVILCQLDPQCERPEERTFAIDLRKYILQHRAELVQAGLTILRAYHVAGRPKQDIKQFGRFEDWSDWVRSALIWVDMEDPCKSRKEVEAKDPVSKSLGFVLSAWHEYLGEYSSTLKQAISKAKSENSENSENLKEKANILLDAFRELCDEGEEINIRVLGKKFSSFKKRIENGFFLESCGLYQNADTWRVKKIP